MPVCSKLFLVINDTNSIKQLIGTDTWQDNEKIILGGGSNVFFTQDFQGITLYPEFFGINIIDETSSDIVIEFGASESWDDCVKYCVDHDYHGIENLSGIPGTIGAAPVQNIGAYGVELQSVFESASAINIKTGETAIFNKADCHFNYRDSIFKHEQKDQQLIYSVCLKLSKEFSPNLSYSGLKSALGNNPSCTEVRGAVLAIRSSKLPDPKLIPNAGSFFKNPIIDDECYSTLKASNPEIPSYPAADNRYKIPAGWLIEQSGMKNYTHKNVGTHKDHALVLTNQSNGSSQQLQELIKLVINKVNIKFSITLEPEVRII